MAHPCPHPLILPIRDPGGSGEVLLQWISDPQQVASLGDCLHILPTPKIGNEAPSLKP